MNRFQAGTLSMPRKVAALSVFALTITMLGARPAMASSNAVTYSPPDMTSISTAQLKHYYKWRHKMDWLLTPIHTRADLKQYLKATATSGSPLDALAPDARERLVSDIQFGPWGASVSYFGDLQYLSTEQVYKILALFGEQGLTLAFTGGRIRPASPRVAPRSVAPSLIQKRFDQYWKTTQSTTGKPWGDRSQRVAHAYDHLFSSKQNPDFVKKVGSHDLRLLFRAATMAVFYTFDAKYTQDAHMDFAELERRHFAGPPDYEQMYQTFVKTRQFAAAHEFYQAHPDVGLTPFPAYRDEAENAGTDAPTVLAVSTTKRELIRRPVNLDAPAQVVILTDPNCHFCADFDQAIQARPKLRAILEQHAIWVTPPGAELEFDSLQQWNRAHPHQPVSIMYSSRGWPMTEVMGTPIFFFLQNGKLMTKHVGWSGKEDFAALEAGLKKIGLWE